jgi:hypothetical protein
VTKTQPWRRTKKNVSRSLRRLRLHVPTLNNDGQSVIFLVVQIDRLGAQTRDNGLGGSLAHYQSRCTSYQLYTVVASPIDKVKTTSMSTNHVVKPG